MKAAGRAWVKLVRSATFQTEDSEADGFSGKISGSVLLRDVAWACRGGGVERRRELFSFIQGDSR